MVRSSITNAPLGATLEKAQALMKEPYSAEGRERVRVILDMLLDMVDEEERVKAAAGTVMHDAVDMETTPKKKLPPLAQRGSTSTPGAGTPKPLVTFVSPQTQRSDTEYTTADEKSVSGSGSATPDTATRHGHGAVAAGAETESPPETPATPPPPFASSATYHNAAPVAWDISGSLYTQDALRREFKRLDTKRTGFLDLDTFRAYYQTVDDFGTRDATLVERIHRQFNRIGHGRVSFDEFCLVMLRVAGR